MWSKEFPKPNFKALAETDGRVLDWVAARIDLGNALDRVDTEISRVEHSRRAVEIAYAELALANQLAKQAVKARVSELNSNPSVAIAYLARICQETRKFVVKIELRVEGSQGASDCTIHTIDRHGRKATIEVPDRSALSKIFPSEQLPKYIVGDLTTWLQRRLEGNGFAIPFDRGTRFHILSGGPLRLAREIQREVVKQRAEDELVRENHETVKEVVRADEAVRHLEQADMDLHQVGGSRLILQRQMHSDWSKGLVCTKDTIALNFRKSLLAVEKNSQGYSLALNGEMIYRVADGCRVESVSAYRQRDPFRITEYPQWVSADILARSNAQVAQLRVGDFITKRGTVVIGEAATVLGELFEAVRAGSTILPSHDISRTLSRMRNTSDNARESNYYTRHWAQSFIESLSPERVEIGKFHTDGQWKVYVFPDKDRIVAEADHVGNATYVGTLAALPHFLNRSRSDILLKPPSGFLSRVIHQGSDEAANEKWKQDIRDLLA